MKPGPDAISIIAISHGCVCIAARVCGLVALDASKATEVLKDRPAWLQDCRRMEILGALRTRNGGTIEFLYTQVLWWIADSDQEQMIKKASNGCLSTCLERGNPTHSPSLLISVVS